MSAMLPPALLAHTVAAAFAPTGVLAQGPQALHPRAGQQAMAQAVAQAIDDAATLVVEAGTGVGKTFAYLVPALLSGRKVVVSTATKALQDQLLTTGLARLWWRWRPPLCAH